MQRPPLHLSVEAIEKGVLGSSSTKVTKLAGCARLLLLNGRQESFHIRHSEYVFQMSSEEHKTCFL